jgi:NAD(P)-dependent dehydrogenase (short-subunit alcohol dehydrogenase family)
MKEIKGKVAVVTGGASGIGRSTGALLASRGMKVVLADIEQGALDGAVAQLRGRSLDVSGVRTDVSKFDSMSNLLRETLARHGKVHVAFLNAGVSGYAPGAMWEHEINDWAWQIGVNVWGVINGIKALVPAMLEHGEEGQVVITSSSVGVVAPVPSAPEYSMSKAAIFSIAESLYAQLRQRAAKVTASVLVPPVRHLRRPAQAHESSRQPAPPGAARRGRGLRARRDFRGPLLDCARSAPCRRCAQLR